MPSSSPSKDGAAGASREDSFGTGSHPAYSSFSHIEGVSNLAFSVGLREDQAVADEIVSKILPMSKIVPGEPVERRIRRLMADLGDTDLEAAALEIPEYVELQDRLRELTSANASLRAQIEDIEGQIKLAQNKQAIAERNAKTIETNNDKLGEELDEVKSRTAILEVEAEETARENGELRAIVATKQGEIDKLEAQIAERRRLIAETQTSSTVEVIFKSSLARAREPLEDDVSYAGEVASVADRYDATRSRFLYKKMQGTGYPDLASFGSASAKRERLPAAAKGPGRRSRPATVSASGR